MRTFTVEGSGSFPVDMLRYDQCWPSREADSVAVEWSLRERERLSAPERRVTLATNSTSAPTVGRWESFGWRVADEGPRYGRGGSHTAPGARVVGAGDEVVVLTDEDREVGVLADVEGDEACVRYPDGSVGYAPMAAVAHPDSPAALGAAAEQRLRGEP